MRGRACRACAGTWCAVSVEAISWALNLAPVPVGRNGQPSTACKFVLLGLANHAGPDGTGGWPGLLFSEDAADAVLAAGERY